MAETVCTINNIAREGLELLAKAGYGVGTDLTNQPAAIMLRSHKLDSSEVPDSVQAIARAGAGTENIDIEDATERGIVVMNTPGANANAVAELVIGALFASSRNLFAAERFVHELGPSPEKQAVESAKKQFTGHEIFGRRLGVVGLGAVGVIVANDAVALGLDVKAYETNLRAENAHRLNREVAIARSLDEVFEDTDFVSLHIPLLDSTRGIVSGNQLSAMNSGAVLLNFARGGLVNDEELVRALDEGQLSKYVNDFPSSLSQRDDVISLPHLGASTQEAETNCAVMAARQIDTYLSRCEITNSVNFPDIHMARSGLSRVLVLHRNIPHMLANITEAFGDAGINISGSINQSQRDVAATLFDLDTPQSEQLASLTAEISSYDDVLRIRSI